MKLINHAYDYKGDPDAMAAALIDATYKMIDCIGDPVAHRKRIDEAFQAAYDRMKD